MTTQTSLSAYQYIKDSGLLSRMQQKVYDCIKEGGVLTDQDIAKVLLRPINCVTPRRGELVRLGRISCVGTTYNQSGRMCYQWSVT